MAPFAALRVTFFSFYPSVSRLQHREPPRVVRLGLLHVVLPRLRDPLRQLLVHLAHDPAGTPITSERGGTSIPSGSTAPAATTLPSPTRTLLSSTAAHADEAIVLHDGAVEDDPVTHPHPRAHDAGHVLVHVDDGAVLEVGLRADLRSAPCRRG